MNDFFSVCIDRGEGFFFNPGHWGNRHYYSIERISHGVTARCLYFTYLPHHVKLQVLPIMSLFSSSTLSFPISFGRKWHLFAGHDVEMGRRTGNMKGTGGNDFHIKMLNWELERQMKKYEQIKRQKLKYQLHCDSGSQGPSVVSYEWLRRDAPMRPELHMSVSTKREFQELCDKIRPSDLNKITITLVRLLEAKEPPPEDVPRIFVDVLRTFIPDDEIKQKPSNFERVIGGMPLFGSLSRFKNTNKVNPEMDKRNGVTRASVEDVEGSIHRRDYLFLAGTSRLHYLLNLENESQPTTNFSMPFSERETDHGDIKDVTKADDSVRQRLGKEAWQSSCEKVSNNRGTPDKQTIQRVAESAAHSHVKDDNDLDVIDLASASSSEEALTLSVGIDSIMPLPV